ncbi:MAG: orotidine 5'-phosphate decarboxylase / HUMPS family protein, partial [Candidatus Nanopelagicus sp.]
AVSAGATSIVCSPFEVSSLRAVLPKTVLITPGVRDVGDYHGDQVRVMTAQDAIKAGSNFVVIGRSITNLWDGSDKAMRTKIEQIRSSIN